MDFEMKVQSGDAAFCDGNGATELVRLLRETADNIESGNDHGSLFDVNGNGCGHYCFDSEDSDAGEEE